MKIGWFAPFYRWVEYAAFGRALERRRYAFLDRLAGARRVLVPGEGDGRAVARLLAVAPEAEMEVVELSAEMIELARRRVGGSGRVRFRQESVNEAALDGSFDAVVTLFVLDCFSEEEARGLIGRVRARLEPGALWVVAEFAVPECGWRRWHARLWIAVMYAFFGAVTGLRVRAVPPYGKLLEEAGFERVALEEERCGLIRSEVWILSGYN